MMGVKVEMVSAQSDLRALFLNGEYDRCLDTIEHLPPSPEGGLLRSRSLLRMGKVSDARLILLNTNPPVSKMGEHSCALAIACTRLGDFKAARQAISDIADSPGVDRSYHHYGAAFTAWGEQDYESARRHLRFITDAELRPAALEMEGWLERAQGRNREAITRFLSALQASLNLPDADLYVRAQILWALSYLTGEFYCPEALAYIKAGLASLPDSPGFAVARFQALRCSAWSFAQAGNFSDGFRYIRCALKRTPSVAWRVTALCDRAQIALGVRDLTIANDFIEEATECADSVAWMQTTNEERVGLLFLAHLLAEREPAKAQQYLALYDVLPQTDPALFHGRDPAARAFEHFVRGSVSRNTPEGSAHYAEAFRIYRDIGYEWRAILVAAAKDPTGECYAAYITERLKAHPNAWIEAVLGNRIVAPTPKFSRAQIEVLRGIYDGKTDQEIARMTCRSKSTVRDHLKRLWRLTGVKNRHELAVYCAKQHLF